MAMQELKKIDVVSFAVVMGLVYAVIGVVFGVIAAIIGGALALFGGAAIGALGVLAIIIYPIGFFIMGFIGGAIFVIVYNFVASHYRGIRINLETAKK